MVVMPGVDVVSHRQIILEHHLYYMVVHVRIFIVDGNAGRKHVPQYHPFAGMPGNRFVVAWGIAAFHCFGYAGERFYVSFLFGFFHLVVAPVIYHCTAGEHHTAGTRQIAFCSVIDVLKRVQHGGNGASGLFLVAIHQIVECLHLYAAGHATHFKVVAESSVLDFCLFFGGTVFAQFVQGSQNFLYMRVFHAFL